MKLTERKTKGVHHIPIAERRALNSPFAIGGWRDWQGHRVLIVFVPKTPAQVKREKRVAGIYAGRSGIFIDRGEPGENIYGCPPCPVCGSKYCYPSVQTRERIQTPKLSKLDFICDDCGFRCGAIKRESEEP